MDRTSCVSVQGWVSPTAVICTV